MFALAVLVCFMGTVAAEPNAVDRFVDSDFSATDRVCVPLGRPYVTLACFDGKTVHYLAVCEVDGRVVAGDPAGNRVDGAGLFYGCIPKNVRAPGRGYTATARKPGPPGISRFVSYPISRLNLCGWPTKDPGMTGGRAHPPTAREPVRQVTAPWGTRDQSGRESPEYDADWLEVHAGNEESGRPSPGEASYCDEFGLPSLVYLCNFGRNDELVHYCHDSVRGWWYDLYGNQLADEGVNCYCHPVGLRVPPTPYRPASGVGRARLVRSPVVGADYSPSASERLEVSFQLGGVNPWSPRNVSTAPEPQSGLVRGELDRTRARIGVEAFQDKDISNSENACTSRGVPYVTLACKDGPSIRHLAVCGGDGPASVNYEDAGFTEGIGLFHNCFPTNVRALGRGYAKNPGGRVTGPFRWTSFPQGRRVACGRMRRDGLAHGPVAPEPDAAVVRRLSARPWGVRDSTGRTAGLYGEKWKVVAPPLVRPGPDAWSGRSYCDQRGLPTLVYLCGGLGGKEILHFCRDSERAWWYDLFGNQLVDNRVECYCHAVANEYSPFSLTVGGPNHWARCVAGRPA
ncbi:hypothetical protein HRG_000238 [Hirsutella rhossiliensis]|uniref:Uncharacterized protein n=1 Tax=Hirsutella rhossiliensis TaxID=111463 RepID=A0A9P8SNX8_9HYPO|nr:uncharacterized protein HRG_00238 [Hirsutella rhossiliensis]KAH0967596.1 hypothetical protein HRG_00238 [Hirsutella rhossiliensis]